MFTLEQWQQYRDEVSERNAKGWIEANILNEKWREEWRERVEVWKAKPDRWGLPPSPPGMCMPKIEQATMEGCFDWLIKNNK